MLELNRASAGIAPLLNAQSQQAVTQASRPTNHLIDQMSNAAGSASFTDTLASAQAAANVSQNGAPFSAALTQQLQNGTYNPVQPAADQSANGSGEQSAASTGSTGSFCKPAPVLDARGLNVAGAAVLPPAEVGGQVVDAAVKVDVSATSGEMQSPLGSDKAAGLLGTRGNTGEKSKLRKGNAPALSVADAMPGANADAVIGGLPPPVVDAAATSLNAAANQSGDTTPGVTARAGGSKAAVANAGLAFAVKIEGRASLGNSASHWNTSTTTPAQADSVEADVEGHASLGGVASQPANTNALTALKIAPSIVHPNENAASDVSAGQNAPANIMNSKTDSSTYGVVPSAEVPQQQPAAGQPIKALQVQITGADNQIVDLRLMEKSGSLTMSVRSTDGTLTRALQQHLPDLTAKLSDQQIRTEWWRPDVQKVDSSQKQSNSSDGRSADGNGSASAQDKGNQGKGNSGQQGGRDTEEPDWLKELTALRKLNQNGPQYSWHL